MADHYATLGLPPDAASSEIKKRYRKLALAHHPDKVPPGAKEEATRTLASLNEAWRVLGDSDRRRVYDMQREADLRRAAPPPRGGAPARSAKFFSSRRAARPAFGYASRVAYLRARAMEPLARAVARGELCLLFLHLSQSERSRRAAAQLEAASRLLGAAARVLAVDVEAEPRLAQRLNPHGAELPALLVMTRQGVGAIDPPYDAETVVERVSEMLPPVPSVCNAAQFGQLLRLRAGGATALSLAPNANVRREMRVTCYAHGLACATVPHTRCVIPMVQLEAVINCPGVALLDKEGKIRRLRAINDRHSVVTFRSNSKAQ
ncbi:hypothetical protein AB1Y20_001001 [Prymnesium parvum]|uniref:J domain-containing protein n=1 Tax=Prymnesium parvum TaxID=97485 RepID=A0AB34KC30_PRYPA